MRRHFVIGNALVKLSSVLIQVHLTNVLVGLLLGVRDYVLGLVQANGFTEFAKVGWVEADLSSQEQQCKVIICGELVLEVLKGLGSQAAHTVLAKGDLSEGNERDIAGNAGPSECLIEGQERYLQVLGYESGLIDFKSGDARVLRVDGRDTWRHQHVVVVEAAGLVRVVTHVCVVVVRRHLDDDGGAEVCEDLEVLFIVGIVQEVLRLRIVFSAWIDVVGKYKLPSLLFASRKLSPHPCDDIFSFGSLIRKIVFLVQVQSIDCEDR